MAKSAAALRVENVTQRFPGYGEDIVALDNVSLTVREGEFCCLLGPSGCGKSTLLNIIGGLARATSGTVQVSDRKVHGPTPHDVAFVFQESTLLPWYTIIENFNVSAKFAGKSDGWRDRAMLALRSVGMEKFANRFPNELSVGMRQRINLARGLYLDTPIVLMDEPFAALDEQTRMVLGEDLSTLLARTGKTIVFVTHSLAEAVFLADTILVMTARPGKIKATISVDRPHPRSPDFMLEPYFNEVRNHLFALLRDEIRHVVDAMREARDS